MAMPFDELVEKRKAEASKPAQTHSYGCVYQSADHQGYCIPWDDDKPVEASKPDDKMPNCLMCYDTGLTSRGRYSGQPCRNPKHYEPTHKKLEGVDGYYGDDIPVDASKPDGTYMSPDVAAMYEEGTEILHRHSFRCAGCYEVIDSETPQADKGIERLDELPIDMFSIEDLNEYVYSNPGLRPMMTILERYNAKINEVIDHINGAKNNE